MLRQIPAVVSLAAALALLSCGVSGSANGGGDDSVMDVARQLGFDVQVTLLSYAEMGDYVDEMESVTALFASDEAWEQKVIKTNQLVDVLENMIFEETLSCDELREMDGKTVKSTNGEEWKVSV